MKLLKHILLTLSLALLVPAALAGTFSINAWTNDTSSGIVAGQTLWAYHFGNANTATVNGVTVPGTGTNVNPSVVGQFSVAGVSFVLPSDANNLTALGGSGSAVMASSFIYGGAPWRFTVQGLTTGQVYTVSIYGVGWDAPVARASNFTNGTDTIYVNENAVGTDNGLRVDYTFMATATTNLTIVMPTNANTFHTYALALRKSLVVTTNSNAGPGSLRQAVLDAAALPGADTITFAPALSGTTITLTNEIIIGSSLTIDASSLPGGITVSGGNITRILNVNSGQPVSLLGLTLTGGNVIGGTGGAILNSSGTSLGVIRCTLFGNTSSSDGGAIVNGGTLTMSQCTLSSNQVPGFGGAIENLGTLTLKHCTVAGNVGVVGGGIDNFTGNLTLENTIVAGNTSGSGADINNENSTFARNGANLVQGVGNLGMVTQSGPTPINAAPLLAPLGNYGGPTRTMPPLPGSPAINATGSSTTSTDQRGIFRPQGGTSDIGAVEVRSPIPNVIYDSFGFESPRFTLGLLEGQDAVDGPWLQAGTGVATVQNTNVATGTQAVRINRTAGADVRFAVPKTILNVSATQTPVIVVEWMMKYVAANLPPGSFGPLLGMEVYDSVGSGLPIAASAFVDATTQELLFQQPGSGIPTAIPGIFVPPNTWHNYRLELDYTTQTYRLIYDGQEVLAAAFVDPGITDFTDADIAALAGAGDAISQAATGTAYFDNYKVTAQSVGTQILSIQPTGVGQASVSWLSATPGGLLLEAPTISSTNWTLSPSVSQNPASVSTVSNKFHRLYIP